MIFSRAFGMGLLAAFLAAPSLATAQQIECDTFYTTVRGDTLSRIAERAYGNPREYQRIFSVNPRRIRSVNRIDIGVSLFIPCADSADAAPQLQPIASGTSGRFRILTGTNYEPYVGRDLPNGGFSTELVERAMQHNDQPADYRIDVIGDWSAHLSPLLENGAYDIGYPWFKPDCSERDRLGEASRWRCDNLLFSDPLHEIVVTAYGPASAPLLENPAAARGLTICRPSGFFTHDLEAMGLNDSSIDRVAPDTARQCFEMLRDGTVDLVSVNADTADQLISELGLQSQVREQSALSTIQTLRVVGMRTNPQTRILLRRINIGLQALQSDGTFRQIAARHL